MQYIILIISYICFLNYISIVTPKEIKENTETQVTNNIITLPLVPHETVIERRRKRRSLKGSTNNISSSNKRPNTYQRRNLSLLPTNQHITTLYQGYGTHYVDLWVGTPNPQRQTVIVDTGSHLTAFPCSECTDCGKNYHTDPIYDEGSSASFQKLTCNDCSVGRCNDEQCTLGLSYKEGSSWMAYEARDLLFVGSDESRSLMKHSSFIDNNALVFEVKFGCQTSLSGLFKTQLEDGILGMSDEEGSFWNQMFEAKKITKKQFSLCFSHQPTVDRDGTLAGAITFGGRDEKLSSMPLVYAKNFKIDGFYAIKLRKLMFWKKGRGILSADLLMKENIQTLNITSKTLNAGGVIVDSGTTDTYLNYEIRDEFYRIWKDLTGVEYHNSEVSLTKKEFKSLPTILFQIEGEKKANKALGNDPNSIPGLAGNIDKEHPHDILVAVPPSNFMEYDPNRKTYSARVLVNEPDGSVLGANFMMGHDVLFDVDNNRLGITESDCDSTYLFTT